MVYVGLIIVVIIGIYFAVRYVSIRYALQKTTKEMQEIKKDLTQNQMLRLPIPSRDLEHMICAYNETLEAIQKERQMYEIKEKEFKKQIENISHDLRTPLTVILGYLKLMKHAQIKGDKELAETLTIMEQKAETMKQLVAQFYDFSRLTAGDYEMKLSRVDIARILRESLVGNYQVLAKSKLEIKADIPEHPIWVLGEVTALERVFLNLQQNAGRYANRFFRISIKEEEDNVVIFFVNDTLLLPKEDISHVFERFYMQDNTRNQGGTGLGLTVAKTLSEEMGGELKAYAVVEEQGSKGSVVCFELRMRCV